MGLRLTMIPSKPSATILEKIFTETTQTDSAIAVHCSDSAATMPAGQLVCCDLGVDGKVVGTVKKGPNGWLTAV